MAISPNKLQEMFAPLRIGATKKRRPPLEVGEGSAADGVMARKAELFRLIDVAEGYDAVLLPRGVAVVRELQLGVGAALELHNVDFP